MSSPVLAQHYLSTALKRCATDVDRALVYADVAALSLDLAAAASRALSEPQAAQPAAARATAQLTASISQNVRIFREAIEQARVSNTFVRSPFQAIRCTYCFHR